MEDQRLYNSRIINTYIKYIKKCYEHINIDELYEYAHMEPYEVADQNHWFTQEQINLFHEKLAQLTGDANIAREAGRYAASPESIGVMRQYVLGMINPFQAYKLAGKIANQFSRSCNFTAKKISSNKIEIVVTPKEGVREQPFQCENRIGHFESMSIVFNSSIPKIEHPECVFKGGKCCRYIIEWESTFSYRLKRIRNITASLFALISAWMIFTYPRGELFFYVPIMITTIFILHAISDHYVKKELRNSIDNLEQARDHLIQQMDINYNNSLLVHEIGKAINKYISIDEIIDNVTQILEKRLDYDRCVILLSDKQKTRLYFKAGYGYDDKQLEMIKSTEFNLTKPESKGVFVASFREQKPYLVNDLDSITNNLSPRSLKFAKAMGSHSFICCPIVSDTSSVGILAVDNYKTRRTLVESDLRLLTGVASVIGISIRNAELHEERTNQLKSILRALAASIDARDPFTAGHSEKVTEYAIGICKEMNLPADYTEIVGIAASLHDYGKIGIPDALLKKEGILTEEEYEIIKTHTFKTRNILEKIEFYGPYRQIPVIAEAHHEKIDGSGYPRGLKGDEIPLGSRIIAVADFFEAITAKRLYRDPIPAENAIEMLRREIDVHFNREIVEAFIQYYKKTHEAST
jgi:HD-GYP domain-containing protein (c-di-GMP phosphodiesterase class II)